MIDNQQEPETKLDTLKENVKLTETLDHDSTAPETENPFSEVNLESNSQPEATTVDLEAQKGIVLEEYEQIIATLQQEIGNLKKLLDDQTQQVENFKSQYVRNAADFDNFRKRTLKEKEELEQQVKRNTITELLSAIDSFERARSHIKPQNDAEMAIHKSYQGVYKQLVDGLKRVGVSPMRPEGQQFDPNFHEAIYQEPTNEYPEGTILEEVVRGYFLGEKVLRHSMVKVAAVQESVVVSEDEPNSPKKELETTES